MLYLILGSVYFLIAVSVWVKRSKDGNYKSSRVHNEKLWYIEMIFKSLLWLPFLIWKIFWDVFIRFIIYYSTDNDYK